MRELVIDETRIADDTDCYVIAEIGHNHQGSLERCKDLFAAAKWAGADAVKLQKRDNKTLFTQEMYDSPYNSENAFGPTYGLHREALEFGYEEYEALKDYAFKLGITFFATAFDLASADFLIDLEMPAFKVASGDLTYLPLLTTLAQTGKPIILSTGGGTAEDAMRAHSALGGCQRAVLQCTSGYPAKYEELDLNVIKTFRDMFPDTVIGYSGHDNGIAMGPVAYALGARIIEKHFTLDRAAKGTDNAFSLEPDGLRKLVRDLRRVRVALGDGTKHLFPSEKAPLSKMRKNENGQIDLPGRTKTVRNTEYYSYATQTAR